MERKRGKILIIDDEESLHLVLESIFAFYNFEIVKAKNGQEGLEKAHEYKPDLIILDILMPYMNGYEVCKILKADKETRDIPVLGLTVLREVMDKTKGEECGFDGYITKPFTTEMLIATSEILITQSRYFKEHPKEKVILGKHA